jgi:iron complex transport system ATP-binding protein
MILKVDDLAFHYKSHKILNHISFSIQKGEITVILGPNGVGKTTLLKCLNNILSPQKGEILISGQNIRQMNIRQIARQVSYVAQKNEAARISVFDAVLMGRHPYSRYKTTQNDLKKVDAVMKKLNLSHMCLKFLDQMSGGELQKVAIARALVQETDLLLLDEPTSSLDLKNQTNILGLIQRIVKEHDIAAVMTMHDLNSALRYADRFLFLKDKTIYGAGKIDELSPQMVADVYDVNVEILHHKGCAVVVPAVQEERKQEKAA